MTKLISSSLLLAKLEESAWSTTALAGRQRLTHIMQLSFLTADILSYHDFSSITADVPGRSKRHLLYDCCHGLFLFIYIPVVFSWNISVCQRFILESSPAHKNTSCD